MADTNLTNLIVNTLTREQYHNADLTDHGDELFVQSDHAGVFVGGNGVDALDMKSVSNCITYIPQDIKLELNNGTLTLKAGSKLYVPNGFESDGTTPKFDVVTIASDITKNDWGSGSGILFLTVQNGSYIYGSKVSDSGSGTSTESTNGMYYRTNTNVIYPNNNTSDSKQSFPIAIVTKTNGVPTSIDQVFNGFGYIGSTVFALPGVKTLAPNGRNADGTLSNIEIQTPDVITITGVAQNTSLNAFLYNNSGTITWFFSNNTEYNNKNNYNQTNSYIWEKTSLIGTITLGANGVVLDFNTKMAFHAVDYSDTEYIAHQAMPSGSAFNLTLGASDASYTAPADGYVVLRGQTTTSGKAYGITNETNGMRNQIRVENSGNDFGIFLPVARGQTYTVKYEGALASGYTFKFVYTKGFTKGS